MLFFKVIQIKIPLLQLDAEYKLYNLFFIQDVCRKVIFIYNFETCIYIYMIFKDVPNTFLPVIPGIFWRKKWILNLDYRCIDFFFKSDTTKKPFT